MAALLGSGAIQQSESASKPARQRPANLDDFIDTCSGSSYVTVFACISAF